MVWQTRNASPLSRVLKTDPDFNVLIVDNNPAMRSLIRSVLVSFGVSDIQEAIGGSEGLACIRKDVPSIAIVDYDMAPMSGLEFIRHVRRDPDSPDPSLPIFTTTSVPNPRQIFEIRDAGATDILSKPFSPNALGRHVVSALENKREFVSAADYCGPDRRRCQASFSGPDRRGSIDVPLAALALQDSERFFWV
jgi:CheY-like chemotaxis protein